MTGGSTSGTAATNPNASADGIANSNTDKKMFFTTSDLVNRMNAAIKDANTDNNDMPPAASDSGGFELQRKMPDGSYRRAEESEREAADFQAKMKQAGEMIAGLDPPQRIEWAKHQRQEGNVLFAKGDYKEAMDVYLTSLVAMDQTPASSDKNISAMNNGGESDNDLLLKVQIEKEIKLPVLLNLALSALKMGMLSKAEKFCNFAMEMDAGRQSVKSHFRRGGVRMLMGHYALAELDLDKALELLNTKMMLLDDDDCPIWNDAENERAVIVREKQKLSRLVNQADKNRRLQKKAMEKLFQSDENKDPMLKAGNMEEALSLYPEMKGPKQIPMLQNNDHYALEEYQLSWFGWYMRMVGRCAQKLLDIIGDGEEDEAVDVQVDQDLLNKLMEEKKDL
mmetsp:Transcript_30115/g.54572  ORF Transcript_30115/g.54572 Transcript_30115/m.54572 type:complete len:395 (+) Transcript_30115:256-1440(+)